MSPVLLALAVTFAAPAPKDPPKKDIDPLLGEWVAVKAEKAGMPLPIGPDGMSIEFKPDGKVVIKESMTAPPECGYTTDPKKDPAEFDIMLPAAGRKAANMTGIYKVEGDTLIVCLSVGGGRPTKFESAAGQANLLMTLKRVKTKD
jgi:uncharacterized protein (TIGR03067 family)